MQGSPDDENNAVIEEKKKKSAQNKWKKACEVFERRNTKSFPV